MYINVLKYEYKKHTSIPFTQYAPFLGEVSHSEENYV